MEVPIVWLWVSGVFFFLGICAFGAMIFAILKLTKSVQDLQPQVKSLIGKVEDISEKVDGISTSVKSTVDAVGNRAQGLLGTIETFASSGSKLSGQLGNYVAIAMTGLKLWREYQATRKAQARVKGEPVSRTVPAPVDSNPALPL